MNKGQPATSYNSMVCYTDAQALETIIIHLTHLNNHIFPVGTITGYQLGINYITTTIKAFVRQDG